jgi:hypothetical protein
MKVFTRVAGLLVLAAILLIGPTYTTAATPGAGSIGPTPGSSVSWTGGPYVVPTPVPDVCPPSSDPFNVRCDHFYLTVNVPASYWDTHTGGADIQITWVSSNDDFDLFVYDNTGLLVGQSASGGTTSERFLLQGANSAQSPYEVRVVPFLTAAATYNGSATFVSQAGSAPNPPRASGGLAFSPPVSVVDSQRTEGEPVNWIDPLDGSYWESGPWGVTTQQSFIHRSTDGGNQFNIVSPIGLRPEAGPGGGDTDIVTDDQGYAYFTDLESLLNLDCAVSNDHGQSWRRNSICVEDVGDDRQWFAVDNGTTPGAADNTVFLGYRDEVGTHIYSTPGSLGPADPVGGFVYTDAASPPVVALNPNVRCGQLRFEKVLRNLYYPCSADDHVSLTIGHVEPGQRTLIEFHNVELPASPGGGGVDDLFPVVATDAAGNVYMAWVDTNDNNVYYSYSTNGGEGWATPVQVSGADAFSNVMPWIQAGATGRVAVVWYGTPSNIDSDLMPSWYNNRQAATAFKWYGYASLITNAASSTPTFAQSRFTDQPMNYGQICTGGLGCTISGGDRTMADFFAVFLDPADGAMRIVYNDVTSQHHGAHVFEARQVAGPSAKGGTVNRAVPSNPVTDPSGDAQSPHYVPGGPGASLPAFDFTNLKLSQPNASTLKVEMTLLGNPATATPPTGKANSLWWARFQALSVGDEGEESYRIFYVGAEKPATGSTTFFAGSGDSAHDAVAGDGCLTTTPENCKVVQYPAEQSATGTIVGNKITINVPIQGGFGANRPIFGTKLFNVTALSGGRNSIPYDFYADLDATKSFDFTLSGGGPPPPPPPESGCKITGGGTIATGPGTQGKFSLNAHVSLKGKVQYRDGAAADFRSTRLTQVTCNANTGRIAGEGTDNGQMVTFTVDVADNGEAGNSDVFTITLRNGDNNVVYTRSGTLTSGNMQVH